MSSPSSGSSGAKYRPPRLRARQASSKNSSFSGEESPQQKGPKKPSPQNDFPTDSINDTSRLQKRSERFQNDKKSTRTEYGFVSRGEDSRLQRSEEERHVFFDSILRQFVEYCETNSDVGFDLERWTREEFGKRGESSVEENEDKEELNPVQGDKSTESSDDTEKAKNKETQTARTTDPRRQGLLRSVFAAKGISKPKGASSSPKSPTIDSILVSLRKLREALLHLLPDDFSRRVFLFSVRVSAPVGHYQTYVPSIHYLLRRGSGISALERREMALLLVLHVSHVNGDNSHAFRVFYRYLDRTADMKTLVILESWIHGEYSVWVRMYNAEADPATAAIMAVGVRKVVTHMAACITRAYFNVLVIALEEWLPRGVTIAMVQEEYGQKWRVEGDNVVVRERRK